jgi:hypothetical protein
MPLTDEQMEELEDLRDDLHVANYAISILTPKVDQLIEGEMTVEEYEEWLIDHAELMNAIDFL